MYLQSMGTLLTIWIIAMAIYYLCVAGLHLALKLPLVVAFVICLPAMPFIIAYRKRRTDPIKSKWLFWLWGFLYTAIPVFCFID